MQCASGGAAPHGAWRSAWHYGAAARCHAASDQSHHPLRHSPAKRPWVTLVAVADVVAAAAAIADVVVHPPHGARRVVAHRLAVDRNLPPLHHEQLVGPRPMSRLGAVVVQGAPFHWLSPR